ncbi:MAG: acetate--CoA ligase [Alphaproteobacteria bacterium]|nr:acetate--CoA ligase [Alphaproteobacteria bacterium]
MTQLIPASKGVHLTKEKYAQMYEQSVRDPEGFWGDIGREFEWVKPFSKVKNTNFAGDVSIKWFEGGKLNITANCIDRHLATRGNKTAILWEGDDPTQSKTITYNELHAEVCKLANAMKSLGVKKGDRVTIYMPMVPEAAYAMLACARIGAVHSVIFGGFSPDSIRSRIEDCQSDFVITANEGRRGGKAVPLKTNVDAAIDGLNVRHVLVLKVTETAVPINAPRDVLWEAVVPHQTTDCSPEPMDAEDPLFILYTSGSTGKPKGLLHTTAGYMVFAATTHKYVFDIVEEDVYWCTADVGWVTGHSYIVYGPLANGSTTLMFEGVPTYPDASRMWQVVDKHKVTKFYTAPTAIRALERLGDSFVKCTSRATLKIMGSVGEPINPAAWLWYYDVVGEKRAPIMDTWWQTETGGHMITPLPGVTDMKPGSATLPFFGVKPVVYDAQGALLEGECEGMLCVADSWPGQARTIYGDHKRFIETYFSTVKGNYFTSDGCKRDADGYYWITGRVDDVINVSGHRLGTAEIESALVAHAQVSEAAVVGYPHDIKGQGIYAYVTLNAGLEASDALNAELKQWVRKQIGGLAVPDFIHVTPGLPKTRSGKIMRRILRKIAENDYGNLGDTTTLLDPDIVQQLIDSRLNR